TIARRRHDVVGLHIFDEREAQLPNVGLARVQDAESGKMIWLDTAQKGTREAYDRWYQENLKKTRETFLRAGADFVSINTRESYVQALLNLFSSREKRR
ncbi:MAG: DUF58 domain-containing protein, partial [Bacteroidota bacterium]